MFDSLLVKPLIAISILLALTSSILFFLYRSDHQALTSLKTQYKQLQVVSEEQGKTIESLQTTREGEVRVETKYVEKLVDSCKKEKEITNKINSLPNVKSNPNDKTNVIDIDGVLPDELKRLLYEANHPKED
jgi:hypothetical protein